MQGLQGAGMHFIIQIAGAVAAQPCQLNNCEQRAFDVSLLRFKQELQPFRCLFVCSGFFDRRNICALHLIVSQSDRHLQFGLTAIELHTTGTPCLDGNQRLMAIIGFFSDLRSSPQTV
jgi:hypothetical protein